MATFKFLTHTDNQLAGLTLMFTKAHIFHVGQKGLFSDFVIAARLTWCSE